MTEHLWYFPMRYVAAICVAVLTLFRPVIHSHDPQPVAEPDSFIAEYDSYVTEALAESQIPGLAIAVVQNGNIVYMKGFGLRKIGEDKRIDVNTVFRISSLSKGFASVLAGMLVKQGLINWDDHVEAYIPGFALKDSASTRNLSIRHILSHTSGVTSHAFDNLIEANLPFDTIIKKLREAPVAYPVGKCYTYQNTVFSLIGPVIKTATGSEYEEVLNRRLLTPLGMHQTSLTRQGLLQAGNIAYPHRRKHDRWVAYPIKDSYYQVQPAAGLNASINDMALWLCALMGGKPEIVPPDVVEEVTRPIIATPGEIRRLHLSNRIRSAYYGMGWRVFDCAGDTVVFHSGGVKGYLSQLAFLPKKKTGIVVLQNSWAHSPFLSKFLEMSLSRRLDEVRGD